MVLIGGGSEKQSEGLLCYLKKHVEVDVSRSTFVYTNEVMNILKLFVSSSIRITT